MELILYIYIEYYSMKKQRKHNLIIDYECDYGMIGICSHHVDYRLAWGINEKLFLELEKANDDFVVEPKKGLISYHSLFEFKDDENMIDYFLIKNKSEGKFLIPEKQEIDYFLFLLENYQDRLDELMQKLRTVPSLLAVFNFDPEEINSTENLVFN